jgi:hypothetical protein
LIGEIDKSDYTNNKVEEKKEELTMVVRANAIPDPRTVVVMSCRASIACATVFGTKRFTSHTADTKRLSIQPSFTSKGFDRIQEVIGNKPRIQADGTPKVVEAKRGGYNEDEVRGRMLVNVCESSSPTQDHHANRRKDDTGEKRALSLGFSPKKNASEDVECCKTFCCGEK